MPLREKLPSTGALFVFDAAARHRNFTSAAKEFNVTQPAVSRAVGGLERHLGCRLFERLHGTLELTEEGRALHAAVQGGFAQIETAIDEMTKNLAEAKSVTLSITSAFALHWLMPRFHDLQEALPDISVRFELIHGEPYGPLEQADLGLRHAAKPRAGLTITPLVPETVIPVCSPDYLARHGPIDGPRGTAPHTLAVLTGPMRVPWDVFLELIHHEGPRQGTRVEFSDYALLIQSAIKGQCVGLGWWHVVASQIEAGDLVPAGGRILRSRDDYHLVMRGGEGQSREPVRRVQDWLLSEFRGLDRQLAAMGVEVLPF